MREDIQPATVGHPDKDFSRALGRRLVDHHVQHGDHHVDALDREALLAGVGLVQEALEDLDLRQALQELPLRVVVRFEVEIAGLGRVLEPLPLFGDLDVIEVETDERRVPLAQPGDCLERIGRAVDDCAANRRCGHVGKALFRDAVGCGIEFGCAGRRGTEGVELDGEVAVFADAGRQLDGAHDLCDVRGGCCGRGVDDASIQGRDHRREFGAKGLEELLGGLVNRCRILLVPLVQLEHITGVRSIKHA